MVKIESKKNKKEKTSASGIAYKRQSPHPQPSRQRLLCFTSSGIPILGISPLLDPWPRRIPSSPSSYPVQHHRSHPPGRYRGGRKSENGEKRIGCSSSQEAMGHEAIFSQSEHEQREKDDSIPSTTPAKTNPVLYFPPIKRRTKCAHNISKPGV